MREGGSGEIVERLDLRGLRCPLPALKTAARLKALPAGARLDVFADDPLARLDLAHLCGAEGHDLLAATEADGYLSVSIRRGGRSAGEGAEAGHG
ncbi:sulfurtransferase TusA family protein [Aureimonas leprariae]|uniref:Sulfurtransferase TusA family protein n=1 Tax=Plantimonas leprariae TaxID=2615207 RepID=A0A7V7PNV9_9HYPH|nr:sulfurtransferase TusA family protein [Aureimonas leprariae]KAB0679537.1 sulfurtransferase TusA family protein [Aureimonas leprariae]